MTSPDKRQKLGKLRVPEPPTRPGDKPDYSGFEVPVAGAVERPSVAIDANEIRSLAYDIIRVTDDNGRAVGPWAPELHDDDKVSGLRDMLTLRLFDARMFKAQRQGKSSFYMQAIGEEAIACAFQKALNPGDMNFPTYRQQGLLIASGYPLVDMMNQIFSNPADPLGGRQMPVFYASKEHGYFSISGNLGTQFVQAVGWAMASDIKNKNVISAGWIGDGSTAESDFHSAMVFASTFRPPVVLNIVNNQWAISTFQKIAKGDAATFASRGLGFGLPALRVDGNDYLAVYAVAKWAAERARQGFGPSLIEHVTYRDGPHSTSDDPSAYRPKDDASAWPLGDPIERFKAHLIQSGLWSEERHVQCVAEIEEYVRDQQRIAEANGTLLDGKKLPMSSMFDGVYKDMPSHLERQKEQLENYR